MILAAELQRKGIHVALAVIPALAWWFGRAERGPVCTVLWLGFLAAALLDIGRRRHAVIREPVDRHLGHLYRPHEERHPLGSTLYLLSAALCFTIFPATVALAAMSCLIFGDAAAAIVGTAHGRRRIGNGKSLEGAVACLAACLAVGAAIGAWLDPRLTFRVVLCGALVATAAELLVPHGYDNLAMPLLSGGGMILVHPGS